MSKTVTHLVCPNPSHDVDRDGASSDESVKVQAAKARGIPVLTENELRQLSQLPEASSGPTLWDEVAPTRCFTCTRGGSNKFWKVQRHNAVVCVKYGRIGTAGTLSTHEHEDDNAAIDAMQILIESKLKKGYKEV